jgi:hypothetical protein
MAFQDQVEDLTSISVSDTGELSQFLKDGVVDVTNRWLFVRPQDIESFTRESAEQTSNGFNPGTNRIVSVIRENGTDGQWYPCNKRPINLQYLVTDEDSLHYASKYNPVYMTTQNRNVHVFPAPSSAGNDGFKVLYVNYDPEESDGTDLQHDSTGIKWFPDDKLYLVVMYAGIRLLSSTMGSNVIAITSVPPDAPTLSTVSFSAPTVPTTPSDPSISSPGVATVAKADISGDVPAYTKPGHPAQVAFADYWTVADFGDSDPDALSITAVPPDSVADTITDFAVTSDFTDAMTNLETFFDAEDPEMVAAAVQRAQTALQQSLNTFNSDMQKFQASGVGKFSAEVAAYQADVNAQVQEYGQKLQRYQAELTTVYQAWAKTESDNLQVFQLDIQNELNEFNKENARYQANIQAEIAKFQVDAAEAQKEGDLTLQATIQDYVQELALFSGEVQKYQSEIQSATQTMQATVANNQSLLTKFQAETAEYQVEATIEVQEQTTKMQQYQLLYSQLKAEYDQAFMIAAPKQQSQQQVRA